MPVTDTMSPTVLRRHTEGRDALVLIQDYHSELDQLFKFKLFVLNDRLAVEAIGFRRVCPLNHHFLAVGAV